MSRMHNHSSVNILSKVWRRPQYVQRSISNSIVDGQSGTPTNLMLQSLLWVYMEFLCDTRLQRWGIRYQLAKIL